MNKNYNRNNQLFRRNISLAQVGNQNFGRLQVRCVTRGFTPIENAVVQISTTAQPDNIIEEFTSNVSGLTEEIALPAPAVDYSLDPEATNQPYSEYIVKVSAPNLLPVTVANVEIFPNVTALQDTVLYTEGTQDTGNVFVIPPHTLYGDYPPKIDEPEIKPPSETGAIVLDKVVIPEFIVVHDGPPSDSGAKNYYVRFRDYIKNVASSEIYSTWPESTIQANILAIISFTLNRVFTEWYRSKGYNFTITSSTAFDHKWIEGRNIYANIGLAVDELFTNYLSRPNVIQPILTQYCDGKKVQCPNWMTQWGSKDLGDRGFSAIQILRNFYGSSIYLNTANEVAGVPVSWPGASLQMGSSGAAVRTIQEQLNRIADAYSLIPKQAVDERYGDKTSDAVKTFQQIFNLPQTGVVDLKTWYKISGIYVAVTRIGE